MKNLLLLLIMFAQALVSGDTARACATSPETQSRSKNGAKMRTASAKIKSKRRFKTIQEFMVAESAAKANLPAEKPSQ